MPKFLRMLGMTVITLIIGFLVTTNSGGGGHPNIGEATVYADSASDLNDAIKAVNSGSYTDAQYKQVTDGIANGTVISNGDGTYQTKSNVINTQDVWTSFSDLLMTNDDVEDGTNNSNDQAKHPVAKALSDGSVQATLPYAEMARQGNSIGNSGGDKSAGTELASFMATMSHFGYIHTISGNALAAGTSGFINSIFRGITGFFLIVSTKLQAITQWIDEQATGLFFGWNPFALFGYSKQSDGNFLAQLINKSLNIMGINPKLFNVIGQLMLVLLTGLMVYLLMKALSNDSSFAQISKPLKNWIIRIATMFVLLPLGALLFNALMTDVRSMSSTLNLNTPIAQKYFINDEYWAAGLNLSPSGLTGTRQMPYAPRKSNYIDKGYTPAQSRDLIATINKNSYAAIYSGSSISDTEIADDLITRWMNPNNTFNVNTYAGDVRPGSVAATTFPSDKDGKALGASNYSDMDTYVWSAKQGSSGDAADPKSFWSKDAKLDHSIGVSNNDSFNTQSVVLMLQSSLSDNEADFYAYNISPHGAAALVKNVSTVKTQWEAVSLVGSSPIGQFGSWLEMITTIIIEIILYIGAALILIRIGLVGSVTTWFKRLYQASVFGRPAAAISAFMFSIAIAITAILALTIPPVLSAAITEISSQIVSIVAGGFDGVSQIIGSLVGAFSVYWFAIPKKNKDYTPLFTVMNFPTEWASDFDRRVDRMNSGDEVENMTGMFRRSGSGSAADVIADRLTNDKRDGLPDAKSEQRADNEMYQKDAAGQDGLPQGGGDVQLDGADENGGMTAKEAALANDDTNRGHQILDQYGNPLELDADQEDKLPEDGETDTNDEDTPGEDVPNDEDTHGEDIPNDEDTGTSTLSTAKDLAKGIAKVGIGMGNFDTMHRDAKPGSLYGLGSKGIQALDNASGLVPRKLAKAQIEALDEEERSTKLKEWFDNGLINEIPNDLDDLKVTQKGKIYFIGNRNGQKTDATEPEAHDSNDNIFNDYE